jgi:hypothetical protein
LQPWGRPWFCPLLHASGRPMVGPRLGLGEEREIGRDAFFHNQEKQEIGDESRIISQEL